MLILFVFSLGPAARADMSVLPFMQAHIQHIILINDAGLTFDQVLGDLTNGANADPSLTEFGWGMTPNTHRLAIDFVTLDNFYATGDSAYRQLIDTARAKRLAVRNYGDDVENVGSMGTPGNPNRNPFASNMIMARATQPAMEPATDAYFPGADPAYPDTWRLGEWEREFKLQIAADDMPGLTLLRLARNSMGRFGASLGDSATPEAQLADNDFAIGEVIADVARSPYAASTLIFVIGADPQSAPDHMHAQRGIAFVAGPYVKQHELANLPYTSASIVETIGEILGLIDLDKDEAQSARLAGLFDITQAKWRYSAVASTVLQSTSILPPDSHVRFAKGAKLVPAHEPAYWQAAEDNMQTAATATSHAERWNRILWKGLKGDTSYPTERSGKRMGTQYLPDPY